MVFISELNITIIEHKLNYLWPPHATHEANNPYVSFLSSCKLQSGNVGQWSGHLFKENLLSRVHASF